jgi:hypothetical protein
MHCPIGFNNIEEQPSQYGACNLDLFLYRNKRLVQFHALYDRRLRVHENWIRVEPDGGADLAFTPPV